MNQCPHCNAQVRPNSRFCGSCGKTLALASPPQSSSGTLVTPSSVSSQGSSGGVKTQHLSYDAPILTVGWPGGRKERHPLPLGTIRLGRKPGSNDIVLDFPTVSSKHLLLKVTAQGVQITDLKSTNGTQVKGQKIPPNRPYPILLGDMIRIGDLAGNSLSLVLKPASGASLQTRPLGMQQLAQHSQLVIGRDPSCEIHLDHPAVSRRHAEIVPDGGRGNFVLRDLGSFNGTFLNGQPIAADVMLEAGAVIQIGPYKLAYDGQQQRLLQTISRGHTLDAISLELDVGIERLILDHISLSVQAGEFVALVGGSGAGKSTLMKAMNGFSQATGGQMLIDSTDLYANLAVYRPSMAYVPQDDIIHKELPVHRALWYAAKLRLPDANQSYIEERIRDVLQKVDLTRHAEKPVHVLSGGQRKRVSIAVELLSEPVLLFLDEPASGLDPGLEKQLMADLRRLADEGRTVVLVTHATGNIRQCDHLAFLVQGKLAFYGPPDEALRFFDVQGFADIYTKLEREVEPTGPTEQLLQPYYRPQPQSTVKGKGMMEGILWSEHYHDSPIYEKYVLKRQQQAQRGNAGAASPPKLGGTEGGRRGSIFGQMFLLARRHFELIRNDRRTLFTLLFMVPLIMLLFVGVSDADVFTGRELTEDEIAEERFEPQEDDLNEAASYLFKVDEFEELNEQQEEEARELARLGNVLDLELKRKLLLKEQENIEAEDDKLSEAQIEEFDEEGLDEELKDAKAGIKATYTPGPTATTLIAILVLAITQAGTFGAAYEIIKEKAIFQRERAINLGVLAYVLSKVVVLSSFAMIQVASALIIFGIPISLNVLPVFESLPHAGIEIFITLLLGMLASIMLGLFISAAVPRQDVVLYVILVQLFAQMILSGPLLPLPSDIASKAVISHWTTEGFAATIDIRLLNQKTRACTVIEVPALPDGAGGEGTQQPPPNAQEIELVPCKWAPLKDKDLKLSYEHKAEDLQLTWAVLFGQAILWGGLTVVVQWRKK
jgi:ABC-type multidrug transport system ATPase subunit